MANLIIKPSSGGSLKLQEDGGTDALTIDASGNTTLAGTANNLGTVSSATTFPAGMMVGFGKAAGTGNPTGGASASGYESMDQAVITYTPKATGNILLLHASISAYLDNRSKTAYFTWYAGSSNVSDTATNAGGMGLSTDHLVKVHEYGGTANDDFPITGDIRGWWIAQNTNSTAFSVYWKANDSVQQWTITCTLMEIQA